uniref:Uncharacterized protein n=1 Tax=Rhizophora mucronata TaxID=61149 RepID=A0A2P2JLT8_RHIMU
MVVEGEIEEGKSAKLPRWFLEKWCVVAKVVEVIVLMGYNKDGHSN